MRGPIASRLLGPLAALALLAGAPGVCAQSEGDRTTARELAREGQEAFERGDFAVAADRFFRADSLVPAPTLALALARAQVKLGKLVSAYETYGRIVRAGVPAGASKLFKRAVADAETEQAPLKARLAWVVLVVKGSSSARVSIDGDVVQPAALGVRRVIDPGSHVVRIEALGAQPVEHKIELAEGQSLDVPLELGAPSPAAEGGSAEPVSAAAVPDREVAAAPPPAAGEHRNRMPAWVAFGVGGLGLVVGGVAGVLALGRHSDLQEACPNGRCPASQSDTLDGYRTLGTVSTIGFVVAGVGAAAGIGLWVWSPGSEGQSVAIGAGPGSLAAWGRF